MTNERLMIPIHTAAGCRWELLPPARLRLKDAVEVLHSLQATIEETAPEGQAAGEAYFALRRLLSLMSPPPAPKPAPQPVRKSVPGNAGAADRQLPAGDRLF